jgi:hypothetical protein
MTNVSRTEQSESMFSIYDGRQCVGFVLARGRGGFEASDAGKRSLGIFETKDAAIHKVTGRS